MKLFDTLATLATLFLATTAIVSCENDTTDDIYPVAQSFTDALNKEFPNAKNVTWELKQQYKVAEFNEDYKSYEVWLDQSATLKMTEVDYGKSFTLVPDFAVQNTFDSTFYADWTVDNITSYTRGDSIFYIIEVEKTGQQDMDVYIDQDGTLIKIANHTRDIITPSTKI